MQKYQSIINELFPSGYDLLDGTDETFELNFALWECKNLGEQELISRSAYFKSINGKPTIHYQTCNLQNLEEIHKNSSFRTKAFFLDGKYSTGYATHSLFPYRGKFHPQMIRALLNMMGVKTGETVLDPMSGSATLSVEANLLNINSIGIDISPFCCLMGRVKTCSLNLDSIRLNAMYKDTPKIYEKISNQKTLEALFANISDEEQIYYEIFLLAYLDSVGFARRSEKSIGSLFPRVLQRYISTITGFQNAREILNLKIGKSKILLSNAKNLPLDENSVDGIITSPPYSFAIDYVENDRPQLEYLGFKTDTLKQNMIGLQGRGIEQKLTLYFADMQKAIKEMSRVLKINGKIAIIIGTNDIQTKGVRLETKVKDLAKESNLTYEMEILKPIKGLNNTMKNEYILLFTKCHE